MSLIILPTNTKEGAVKEAERKLQLAIDDPLTVVMLVYGDSPEINRVVEICTARASVKAAIRRVVWIPDPSVLSIRHRDLYFRNGKAAISIGLDDTIAKGLTLAQAKTKIYVEQAFLYAEGQR